MAIVQNFWLKGASKKLAGAVLYEAMGQTRARQLASSVSNPRTEAQMSQRVKWSNLVNFYRANSSWMKYAFENKKTTQSEYNRFMSLNVTASPIALTKQAAAAGAAVAYSYILTQGSLPSIEWSLGDGLQVSNIFAGTSLVITEDTTVGEFASALIANNPAMREGDQLSFIRVSQMVNASTGYPYIIVRKYEVLLVSDSQLLLNNFIPVEFLDVSDTGGNRTLNVNTLGRKGGFAMILSRTIGGKTYVSSQSLVLVNNEDVISAWTGDAAVEQAIASYGESDEAFLSSVQANAANNSPVSNSIVSITVGDNTYSPGSRVPIIDDMESEQLATVFSLPINGGAALGRMIFNLTNGTQLADANPTVTGGRVIGVIPDIASVNSGSHVSSVEVEVDGIVYRFRLASANTYQTGGLEE